MASSSSFRASNFINYGPDTQRNSSSSSSGPTNLVAMKPEDDIDEPQISALRDEASPPPPEPPAASAGKTKFKGKNRNLPGGSGKSEGVQRNESQESNSISKRKRESESVSGDDEAHESRSNNSEEELDELWAEEDGNVVPEGENKKKGGTNTPTPSQGRARGTGRGGRGRGRGRGRGGAVSASEPPQTIFEITPNIPQAEHGTPGVFEADSASVKTPRKKRGERAKKGERKPKGTKALQQIQDDNASIASDSHVGTAASSPYLQSVARESNHGGETPDIEPLTLTQPPESSQPVTESIPASSQVTVTPGENIPAFSLDSVPIPIYRLPTKPFLVQPPPKAPSGFSPFVPLDKNRAPVRRWRPALRAIRGIAGGQWFARTWVGDKESEYSLAGHDEPPTMGILQPNSGVIFNTGRGRGSGRASPAPVLPKPLGANSGSLSATLSVPGMGNAGVSVGAGTGSGKGSGRGGARTKRTNATSTTVTAAASTAASSRSGSVDFMPPEYPVPPLHIEPQQQMQQHSLLPPTQIQQHLVQNSSVRTPSKMRYTVSAQDSDFEMEGVEEIEAQ